MTWNLAQQLESLWESVDSPPDIFGFLAEASASTDEVVSVVLTDQRLRWKTDTPLRVEDYLEQIPELSGSSEIKMQLTVGEYQARQATDTVLNINEYTARFNDIGDQLRSRLSELADQHNAAETTYISEMKIGDQQLGRYRLERILGEGAFGRVHLAYDLELQRQVAVKVPRTERFQKPEDAEQYLAEARTVAGLDHPNIVPVHDVGRTADGSIYVVSKFIEGCTLDDRIKTDRPDHEESARMVATIARALQHAHHRRLIHRDVKPGNILLESPSATPHITDFGLAIREEDYLKQTRLAGTPAYMSPEQARGEGHRLDGRSDIFSLGVVLYELLTGQKPLRGSTPNELMHQLISVNPRAPREIDESIPAELERICLKAMSKRASDRYRTALELADDLQHWNQSPQQQPQERLAPAVVPKGLRSFGTEDADFFLDLLPGPRTRGGLPESIQFWKSRIEEPDPDRTFSVGLIYGPSGCGKSSLVKAGLLPHLSDSVAAIHVEATPDETEIRILRTLRKALPELPHQLDLIETFSLLRRAEGRKVVVVIDQFEQWLHTHRTDQGTELIAALRQCDGGNLQSVVLVRDDFWLTLSRFMNDLEIELQQGDNIALVDLFDIEHAEKVLIKFGQAFGRLPARSSMMSDEERSFVHSVAAGLAQDGKVISVRLSLFAEMIKGKPWIPATLADVGGTEGVGVNFLDETFSQRTANPKHRLHQQAARAVLGALLPDGSSDIKGHMRSHQDLLEISGYAGKSSEFHALLRILDGELRLITPTDPEGLLSDSGSDPGSRFYQLTHDYLVPSLQDWLTRKQQETRQGRAEIKLADRAALWNARPEHRHLPSFLEYAGIRCLTEGDKWTEPQRRMMRRAGRKYGVLSGVCLAAFVSVVLLGITIWNAVEQDRQNLLAEQRQEQRVVQAGEMVTGLLQANTSQIEVILGKLDVLRQYAKNDLQQAFADSPDDSDAKLHAALALRDEEESVLPFLADRLLTVTPVQFSYVRDLLKADKDTLVDSYWKTVLSSTSDDRRFQAACALATYDPENERWQDQLFQQFLADHLVNVRPSELVPWTNALRPVKGFLTDALSATYRSPASGDQVRSFATDTLADFLKDDAERLFDLCVDSNQEQFETMFQLVNQHRSKAIALANMEITKTPDADASESLKQSSSIRKANAAVILLRMDETENVWPLLKHGPDPRIRSNIIHWLKPRGGNARSIIDRLKVETDVTIKRALLLCLGTFELSESDRELMIGGLLKTYRTDPDAGLHAAAEWLLRQWDLVERVEEIDIGLAQKEEQILATEDRKQNWYLNSQGQTFVILDAGDFQMGSLDTEANRGAEEIYHRRRIGKRIAISTKEVTRKQWRPFSQSNAVINADEEELKPFISSDDSPMVAMTWFEAAWYCNWLSEQEGIPESQWCYERNDSGEYGIGMRAKDNFLSLTGYRLPTEAEWEFACRAGTTTSWYHGESDELLSRYAWYQVNSGEHSHPVARLQPNDFGLFDMEGNAFEWCYDLYARYPIVEVGEVLQDGPPVGIVTDKDDRVLRGGSYGVDGSIVRSASRLFNQPLNLGAYVGFRTARTFPESR